MLIRGAKVFDVREGFVERELCTDGALIAAKSGDGAVLEAEGCYVIPGLTDVHFHGCVGEDFSDASADGLQKMADTKRELTNGYRIRRGAIDHNIPLITNARLASAFIEAFCTLSQDQLQIKSWQEYE